MKKYITYFLVVLLFTQISCDPTRVDSEPIGNTEADFFSNNAEFLQSMITVYAKFNDYYWFRSWDNWVHGTWLLPGDDLTESNGTRVEVELFSGALNSTSDRVGFVFDKSYEIIARANVTLEKTRTIDFSDYDDPADIAAMEGESLFLRAYVYYKLFNLYGSVPIITERIITEDMTNTPKSDKMAVLEQVITDAQAAIAILPESWAPEYAGRATKNSARGLLVKALVFKGNYTGDTGNYSEALTIFNTITASLTASYTDNFNAFTENNQESLFEIQASAPSSGTDNVFLYNDGAWRGVENMSVFRGMTTPSGKGNSSNWAGTKFLITQKLLTNFGTDPRIDVFLQDDDGRGGLLFQKYTLDGMESQTDPFQSSANNERVLRYADLKLLAAEAALKTGNPGAAIGHINDVRARARDWGLADGISDGTIPADYSTSETNAGTIMQWIMDERFVELAGEGQRWFDLKRWHESGDISLAGWGGGIQHFSTALASPVQFDVNKHLLFPIPQTEIDRNSEITENNPGY